MKISDIINEDATAGSTGAGNIAALVNPGSTLPKSARTRGTKTNRNYVGDPFGNPASGTKTPPQPKPKKQKPTDNALDQNVGFFTGGALKR